jgi:hypothetical protein
MLNLDATQIARISVLSICYYCLQSLMISNFIELCKLSNRCQVGKYLGENAVLFGV